MELGRTDEVSGLYLYGRKKIARTCPNCAKYFFNAAWDLNPSLLILRTLNTHLSSQPLKFSNTDAKHIITPEEDAAAVMGPLETVLTLVWGGTTTTGVGSSPVVSITGLGGHNRVVRYSQQAAVSAAEDGSSGTCNDDDNNSGRDDDVVMLKGTVGGRSRETKNTPYLKLFPRLITWASEN